jgi:hypothetical protein
MLSGGRELSQSKSHFSLVRIFTYHNEEYELISDWLQYHAYLVGFDSLHIIDQSSSGEHICKLLTMFHLCGAHITTVMGSFTNKFVMLTKEMTKYKSNTKFLVPLDTDEFITVSRSEAAFISADRNDIMKEFQNLQTDGRKYKFVVRKVINYTPVCVNLTSNSSYPHIEHNEYYRRTLQGSFDIIFSKNIMLKTFFWSVGFIATDQGNHFGTVKNDELVRQIFKNLTDRHYSLFYIDTNLHLLHFDNPSFGGFLHKVKRGAVAYGFNRSAHCIRASYCGLMEQLIPRRDESASSHNNRIKKMYIKRCRQNGNYSFHNFQNWVKGFTLTFREIVDTDLTLQ